jgi:hypothetical protein
LNGHHITTGTERQRLGRRDRYPQTGETAGSNRYANERQGVWSEPGIGE